MKVINNTDKLKRVFAESLGISANKVKNSLAYQKEPKWDSISHMVLVSNIENEFEISFDTDEVIAMSTFAIAVKILKKHKINFNNVTKK